LGPFFELFFPASQPKNALTSIDAVLAQTVPPPNPLYTQEGNKLNFLRNQNHLFKPQRGDINIAWGSAPGNPSYDHVEYNEKKLKWRIGKCE
jgi:hypothetical protein